MLSWTFGRQERICAVLDIGSHKVACAVLTYVPGARGMLRDVPFMQVHGFAAGPCAGWSAGEIRNLGAAVKAIRRTLARAEAAAGTEIHDIFVVASFSGLTGEGFRAGFPLVSQSPSDHDFDAVHAAAESHAERGGRRALHLFTAGYGVEAPNGSGYSGAYLTVDFRALTIPGAAFQSLVECLRQCQLSPRAVIAAPYAGALAVTGQEDRDLGICLIDLGARTSSAIWFDGGELEHVAVTGEGGAHITAEIARVFSLPRGLAEHVKLCHGSVFDFTANDLLVPLPEVEDREPLFKSQLNGVIRERQKRILESLKGRLMAAGFPSGGPEPVVLTGGGSGLAGVTELAAQVFGRDVFLGQPAAIRGLKAEPGLSALAGGCLYAAAEEWREPGAQFARRAQRGSYANRIGQWLRAGF